MLIVFWSPYHGQTGTTTTVLNHSIVTSLMTGKKVLLGHGDFIGSTLEDYILGGDSRDDSLYMDQGLNALINLAKNGRLSPSMIKDYTTPILSSSRLDLMQAYDVLDENELELNILRKIFLYCKDIYDYCFLDLHSGSNKMFTKKMILDADVVVICLNQNLSLDKYFFANDDYMDLIKDKNVIYHLNKYNPKSKFDIRAFKNIFKVKELIYTRHYDAIVENQNAGASLDYILREYSSKKSNIMDDLKTNVNKIFFNK